MREKGKERNTAGYLQPQVCLNLRVDSIHVTKQNLAHT